MGVIVFIVHVHRRIFVVVRGGAERVAVGIDHCCVIGHTGGAGEGAVFAEVDDAVDGHCGCEAPKEAGGC